MSSGSFVVLRPSLVVFSDEDHEAPRRAASDEGKNVEGEASMVFLMRYIVDEITLSGLISITIKYLQVFEITISLCKRTYVLPSGHSFYWHNSFVV